MNKNNYVLSKVLCIISSLWKQWRVLILLSCLVGIVYDVISFITYEPIYSANVTCAIVNSDGKGIDNDKIENASASIQYLFNSQYMKDMINQELDQNVFDGHIDVSLNSNTNFCSIRVLSSNQKSAYFELEEALQLYNHISEQYSFGYDLTIVEDISFTNLPLSYHNHLRSYTMGFVACFILCCLGLGLFYYFRDNIKNAHEINDKIDAKLYAKIPKEFKRYQKWGIFSRKKSAILVSHFKTSFSYVEAMNRLASKVEMSQKKHGYQTFLMTSSLENEGKSSIAVNLAISLAKNKHKVLIIDADLRKPSLHKIFEREVSSNIIDVLEKKITWQKSVVTLDKEHIDVIFSKVHLNSQDLLSNFDFNTMLEEMKKEYDFIIVDSAPCRFVIDTVMIANTCDATFMVIKQNDANCKVINDSIYRLTSASAHVIGSIYNESVFNPFYSHSRYGYGYKYGYYRYYKERKS